MATLVSPGVDITITDDSSYATVGTGTVPLIIFGTHENKTTPSGSIASGTLSDNAGKLYYMPSQREVVQTFGDPVFYSSGGTPVDGYELNEYGLHALYETTSISPAFALRASIDFSDLVPTTTEPRGEPADGTYWLNPVSTSWGIYQSNGSVDVTEAWAQETVTPIVSSSSLELSLISNTGFADTSTAIITDDSAGNLVINNVTLELNSGSNISDVVNNINAQKSNTKVSASIQYIAGKFYLMLTQTDITGSLTIDYVAGTTEASTYATLVALGLYDSTNNIAISGTVRPSAALGGNGDFMVNTYHNSNVIYQKVLSIIAGDTQSSLASGVWYIVGTPEWVLAKQNDNTFYATPSQKIPTSSKSGDVWFNLSPSGGGLSFYLQKYSGSTGTWTSVTVNVYNTLADLNTLSPSVNDVCAVSPYAVLDNNVDNTGTQSAILASSNILRYNGSYWEQLAYVSATTEPTKVADAGTLWFNNSFVVDIMINLKGENWVGYSNYTGYTGTDPNGPTLAGSKPTSQSTGGALVNGDIWIDTSDTENYPKIYRYSSYKNAYVLINNADHTSPSGIVFADARASNGNGSTSVTSLLSSNFVDPDAPNPELYPDGTLLFNTRISTNNVKEWHPNYFTSEYGAITENGVTTVTDYTSNSYTVGGTTFAHLTDGGRWVTVSGNYTDGSPKMGRHAQRSLIVQALQSVIDSNEDVRSETFYYTLIASPGYPEMIPSMVELSDDIHNKAFVIGDTPSRMRPTASDISTLIGGTEVDPEFSITTASPYLGVYYPWGKGENTDGSDVVIPPSTMILRVIINSDNMSYPWYPPAGFTRGLVDNATNVGYIDPDTGSYTLTILNQSQRDILYQNNLNPIAYMVGKGLVAYGQKTMNSTQTALDRINVARLICYLNYQLDALAKPFLFELNTSATRANVKTAFDRFLSSILSLSGVTDYIVVCDTSNNTDATIDAHELWIDIAIVPSESIEFIYIPLRIENTGTNLSSLYT